MRVLVFEGDAAFASQLERELADFGCNTEVVSDADVGLARAFADAPDLVLLSIELSKGSAFSVCNKLKKDSKLKGVPIIMMSKAAGAELFEQHRKLRTHADDYVRKPITGGDLWKRISALARPSD